MLADGRVGQETAREHEDTCQVGDKDQPDQDAHGDARDFQVCATLFGARLLYGGRYEVRLVLRDHGGERNRALSVRPVGRPERVERGRAVGFDLCLQLFLIGKLLDGLGAVGCFGGGYQGGFRGVVDLRGGVGCDLGGRCRCSRCGYRLPGVLAFRFARGFAARFLGWLGVFVGAVGVGLVFSLALGFAFRYVFRLVFAFVVGLGVGLRVVFAFAVGLRVVVGVLRFVLVVRFVGVVCFDALFVVARVAFIHRREHLRCLQIVRFVALLAVAHVVFVHWRQHLCCLQIAGVVGAVGLHGLEYLRRLCVVDRLGRRLGVVLGCFGFGFRVRFGGGGVFPPWFVRSHCRVSTLFNVVLGIV